MKLNNSKDEKKKITKENLIKLVQNKIDSHNT